MISWQNWTPESKLNLIREYQTGGRTVAMTGDGTNDAPALAQADVAVAMNTGDATCPRSSKHVPIPMSSLPACSPEDARGSTGAN